MLRAIVLNTFAESAMFHMILRYCLLCPFAFAVGTGSREEFGEIMPQKFFSIPKDNYICRYLKMESAF